MRPYFPILKGKRGEYEALAKLDPVTHGALVPIIELLPWTPPRQKADRPPPALRTVDQQVNDHVRNIAQSSGDCYRVLIDFTYLPDAPTSNKTHPAAAIIAELRSRGVKASPVIRPTSSLSLLAALRKVGCFADGAALRVAQTDFDYSDERIEVILSTVGVKVSDVDAIVDFGHIDNAGALWRGMTNAALTVLGQSDWRTLSLGAASFPSSLSPFPEGEHWIPRLEWQAFLQLDEGAIGREVGYADYGMRDPAVPVAGGSEPVPNLRYTVGDQWLVLKGKAVDREIYSALARDLLNHSEWMKASHCTGCAGFSSCANGDKGKTAEQAIRFAMAHHLTSVRQQLANLGAGVAGL